jgi:N-dimethylarginine dimethylaminohydrolase
MKIMSFERRIVMTDPAHFEVCYAINPWMQPGAWAQDPAAFRRKARASWDALAAELRSIGFIVEVIPAAPGLPDLVFPANAGVAFNGKVLLARFRHPERQGEEPVLKKFFEGLKERGLVDEVLELPEGVFQEGAGDCIWDASRQLFWAGYGPRSSENAIPHLRRVFGEEVVALELRTAHFYHLDTCFCPLPGGEVMYYPGAFTPMSLAEITARVPAHMRITATVDEAASFSLNAVAHGRDLVMAPPPERLRAILEERGYRVHDVDLSSYMLSGGAAYCMTLRLDRRSERAQKIAAE